MFIECIRNRTESTESLGTLRFYLEEKQANIRDHSRTKYQVWINYKESKDSYTLNYFTVIINNQEARKFLIDVLFCKHP